MFLCLVLVCSKKVKERISLVVSDQGMLSPSQSGSFIASRAKDVRIVEEGVKKCTEDIVRQITEGQLDMTKMFIKTDVHPQQSDDRGIDWVFFADTLNFCFW